MKVPWEGISPPITVLSIVPPLISVVVRTEFPIVILPFESSMVAAEVPFFALRFVTSRFRVSVVVALTVVISAVVDVRVVIVVAAMVPPSTLSPLI